MDENQLPEQPPAEPDSDSAAGSQPAEPEPGPARSRFRQRYRGWLVYASLCALLPALVALLLAQRQFEQWQRLHQQRLEQLQQQLTRVHEQLRQSSADRADASRQLAQLQQQLQQARGRAAAWRLAAAAAARLAAATEDEAARQQALGKLVQRAPDPLAAVALAQPSGPVWHHSKGLDDQTLQLLKRQLRTKAEEPASGWQVLKLPEQKAVLAYRLPAPAPDSSPQPTPPPAEAALMTPAIPLPGTALTWAATLGTALLLLLLAASGQRRLFSSLEQLAEVARTLPLAAADHDPQSWPAAPELASLSNALASWREARLQLDQQQQHQQRLQRQLQQATAWLRALTNGDPPAQSQLTLPELQPLQLALEDLTQKLAGRMTAVAGIGTRLQGQAEQLLQLARRLRPQSAEQPEGDFSPLADILDHEVDQLADTLRRLHPDPGDQGPAPDTVAELEQRLQTLVVGMQEYSRRVRHYCEQLSELPEQARLLATALAVIAEAHALDSLATPRQQSAELAERLRGTTSGLQQAADSLQQHAGDLAEALKPDSSLWASNRRLDQERRRFDQLGSQAQQRLQTLLPLLKPVTGSYRRLQQAWSQAHRRLEGLSGDLDQMCRVAEGLGESTANLVSELAGWWPEAGAPASVSRQLLQSQQALHAAMRQIEQLSERHGIQSLSEETARLLADIRQYAEQARQAIAVERAGGEKSAPS